MKFLLSLIFFSYAAYADYPSLKVENISGKFYDDKGSAYAELANFEFQQVAITQINTELNFNRPDKNLILQNDTTTIKLRVDFSFLNILDFFDFNGVNIQSDLKKFDITAPYFTVGLGKTGKYTLRQIEIESDITNEPNTNRDIDILVGFLINGELNIKSISLGILNGNDFVNRMIQENPESEAEIKNSYNKGFSLPLTIRNLRLLVKQKIFSGSAFLDSWLNATVYYGGRINYNQDDNILTISLLKAKVGYFSIRKLLLYTISKLGIDSLKVRGSDIIIDLGKTYERESEV